MGKRKVENAVECAFPATWERAAPYKPWRTAPSTPGSMSVADGEVLRAVLPNSATDADVSAALSLIERLRIRQVSLTRGAAITRDGLKGLAALSGAGQVKVELEVRIPRLQQLSIQCTTKVTDDGYTLLERARKLESLELSYARNLTEQRLFSIAAALPSLRELTIGQCPDLTDEGILELVRTAKLRSLKIPYCKQITEAGYAAVRELLPDME